MAIFFDMKHSRMRRLVNNLETIENHPFARPIRWVFGNGMHSQLSHQGATDSLPVHPITQVFYNNFLPALSWSQAIGIAPGVSHEVDGIQRHFLRTFIGASLWIRKTAILDIIRSQEACASAFKLLQAHTGLKITRD